MLVPSCWTQLVFHRKLPNPPAGRCKDGVRDRGHHRRGAGLADATGWLGALDQMDLDHGRLAHAQHPVVVEVVLLDAAVLDGDLTPQRPGDPEDDAAFHLGLHDVGIDHGAAIDHAHYPLDAHVALLRYFDVGDLSDVAPEGVQ